MKILNTALILFNALTSIVSTEANDSILCDPGNFPREFQIPGNLERCFRDFEFDWKCIINYAASSENSERGCLLDLFDYGLNQCHHVSGMDDIRHDDFIECMEMGALPVQCGNHVAATCAECPSVHGAAWCNGECKWSSSTSTCYFPIAAGKSNPGRARRALASDEQVLLGPEFDDCWEENYDNALYADSSHVSYLAVPKNKDSNCPIIALDNGFSEGINFEQGGVLAPMLTILHEVPEGVLFLDYSVTLKYFLGEINQLIPASYVISENEYNILHNNCATYMLDLMKKVGLDYKDPNTATNIENYVGKSIASNDITVGKIRKAYIAQNKGIYHKASFYVWNFAVGDEGMTRALVRSYMNKMVEE